VDALTTNDRIEAMAMALTCKVLRQVLRTAGLLLFCGKAFACFDLAAQRYNVSPALLQAIAQHESGGRATVINTNPNGSRDIGLMQINSSWLPTLARHGISERDLYDPCVNVLVGAWILSNNFARLGYTTQGLGAYNASSPDKRERYAQQVLRRMTQVAANP
jgi:soluble lytic murein transglycosylase-like protein